MSYNEQDKIISDYMLNLIIGKDIPSDAPKEFSNIKMYIQDDNDNLNLYADIHIPYLINYSEFLNIENDPRYYLYEGYDFETKSHTHMVEIKPFGQRKGVYRILNGQSIKVWDIDSKFEFENNGKSYTIKNKKSTN